MYFSGLSWFYFLCIDVSEEIESRVGRIFYCGKIIYSFLTIMSNSQKLILWIFILFIWEVMSDDRNLLNKVSDIKQSKWVLSVWSRFTVLIHCISRTVHSCVDPFSWAKLFPFIVKSLNQYVFSTHWRLNGMSLRARPQRPRLYVTARQAR